MEASLSDCTSSRGRPQASRGRILSLGASISADFRPNVPSRQDPRGPNEKTSPTFAAGDGFVYSCGDNTYGRLGFASKTFVGKPKKLTVFGSKKHRKVIIDKNDGLS